MYRNRPLIEEDKKDILMNWVNQLENDLSDLYHEVDEDESIPEESFKYIEKRIEALYVKINRIREEIYYS